MVVELMTSQPGRRKYILKLFMFSSNFNKEEKSQMRRSYLEFFYDL